MKPNINCCADVVETLKTKDEYVATLRFICEFRLSKLCPGWRPRTVLHEFLQSLTRVDRVTDETGNFLEVEVSLPSLSLSVSGSIQFILLCVYMCDAS